MSEALAVAPERLLELEQEMKRCEQASRDASNAESAASKAYAEAKAASIGLRIGSIVTVTENQGLGSKKRTVVKRYRIISINYSSYRTHNLNLWGRTIRKDGSDGEKHEIWQDWEIEQEKPCLS